MRRPAAILGADVARFLRLMKADGEGTLARLKSLRRTLKTASDGMLIEFADAVEAAPIVAG